MQCQYGKSGHGGRIYLPCVLCLGPTGSLLTPWPIWLSCWEGRSPVGSQIALQRPGPQLIWKPCNLSWASRWGRLRLGKGGRHLQDQPRWCHGSERPRSALNTPWAAQGLACGNWEATPGLGSSLKVRLDPGAAVRGEHLTALRTGFLVGLGLDCTVLALSLEGSRARASGPSHTTPWTWVSSSLTWAVVAEPAVHQCVRWHYICHLTGPHHSLWVVGFFLSLYKWGN